jgi:hypothetical protein
LTPGRLVGGWNRVEPTGLRFLFDDPDVEEISAALDELVARRNGTDPTE